MGFFVRTVVLSDSDTGLGLEAVLLFNCWTGFGKVHCLSMLPGLWKGQGNTEVSVRLLLLDSSWLGCLPSMKSITYKFSRVNYPGSAQKTVTDTGIKFQIELQTFPNPCNCQKETMISYNKSQQLCFLNHQLSSSLYLLVVFLSNYTNSSLEAARKTQ